ncbi:MAG TPA: general secretion pathway protein GspB [Cellvibrio sp.]|nr:general secretion pathway protein GspB [Cellvibrio sp.]
MFKRAGLIFAYTWLFTHFSQISAATLDPTRPLGYEQSPANEKSVQQTIVLNSILISRDRKLAIINGQQLREGQSVKGVDVQLKRIDADSVVLQQGGKVWRVSLNTTTIRK